MSFVPWFIAALIAVGSVALLVWVIRQLLARIAQLEHEGTKKDELIEILRGEITDLNRALGQEEGTFAASVREAKRKKQVKEINKEDDKPEPQPKRDEPPPADWMPEDEQ